jgi:hypothetical protein
MLTISFGILCGRMINSLSKLHENYGYEVLVNLLIHFYMMLVVYIYAKESWDEYISKKTLAPSDDRITTTAKKRKAQLSRRRQSNDSLAIAMYEMTPSLFLAKHSVLVPPPNNYSSSKTVSTMRTGFLSSASFISVTSIQSNVGGDNESADFDIDDDDSWDEEKTIKMMGPAGTVSLLSTVAPNTLKDYSKYEKGQNRWRNEDSMPRPSDISRRQTLPTCPTSMFSLFSEDKL